LFFAHYEISNIFTGPTFLYQPWPIGLMSCAKTKVDKEMHIYPFPKPKVDKEMHIYPFPKQMELYAVICCF